MSNGKKKIKLLPDFKGTFEKKIKTTRIFINPDDIDLCINLLWKSLLQLELDMLITI